jgi:hypothetical protein
LHGKYLFVFYKNYLFPNSSAQLGARVESLGRFTPSVPGNKSYTTKLRKLIRWIDLLQAIFGPQYPYQTPEVKLLCMTLISIFQGSIDC